jgi:hypothetical protein
LTHGFPIGFQILFNGDKMTRNEKYIARIVFKLKIYQSDGQTFEDLFVKVMGKSNSNFKPVKAHGKIGDMKNDGFDKTTGTYYQVFAPEDVEKGKTIHDAVKKVRTDFGGLKSKWNEVCPLKKFYYVVNDKYNGIPAPIHQELLKLDTENPDINCESFSSSNLEDVFILLSDDDIVDVIQFNPDENIGILDFSILNEAIIYIKDSTTYIESASNLIVPDFGEKIEFNDLSDRIKHYLTYASYQIGDLEDYFKANSEFVRTELQSRFKEMYKESKYVVPYDEKDYSDKRFMYILKKASANELKAFRDAVLVLMSYYFESCDIFEEPQKVVTI